MTSVLLCFQAAKNQVVPNGYAEHVQRRAPLVNLSPLLVRAGFQAAQVVLAVIVIVVVLLQVRNAGVSALGGSDSSFFASRRGIDRVLFNFTIGISILFFFVSVLAVRFQ